MKLAILILTILAACSTQSTQADIAGLEVSLTTAEHIAIGYTGLPACGSPGATIVCADPGIKARIKAADNMAYNAVKQAEANTGTIAAATAAISALTGIVPKVP